MDNITGGGSRQGELLVQAILFFGALGLFSLQWFGPAFSGIMGDVTATAAERVQAGDIPYRDFWTMYAPGSYYLLALLFSIFGNHILVSSVAASILSASAVSLCYRLVHRLVGGIMPALACAGIFFAAIYMTAYYYLNLGPYPPVIVCVLLALNFIVDFHKTGSTTSLFVAGLATGLAIVFKHDVGGYAAIAMTAGLITGNFCKNTVASHAGVTVKIAIYSMGVAAVSLPVAIYFAVLAGPDMWRDLIVFPATDFHFARGEHYPGLLPTGIYNEWWLMAVFNFLTYLRFTIPFIVVVLSVITLVIAGMKRNTDYLPMGVTFAVLYLLHYSSAHIQINTNIISMPLYAAMLGAISYRIVDGNIRESGQLLFRLFVLALAAVSFLVFFLQPLYKRITNDEPVVVLVLPKIAGISASQEMNDTLTKLVDFVNENVPPGKRMFIGLHRHDTTVIGDGKMYFILDRLNATRQDQLHPGIVDTTKIQREMIRDLQAHDVRYILLKHNFGDKVLDEFRKIWSVTLPESGSTELDEYIRAKYRKVRTIGQYEIWRKFEPDEVPVQ